MKPNNVVNFPGKRKGWTTMPAVYTFVFTTLIGPAIAAAILGLLYVVSFLVQKGPPSVIGLKGADFPAYLAERVLAGYVWSAIPAVLTAAVVSALVYRTGTFHWLYGAVAAAVSASLMAVVTGGQALNHTSSIALIAAITAVLGRMVLVAAKIVE